MPRKSKKESGNAAVRRIRRRQAALNWRLPPLPWILSAGSSSVPVAPARILFGGCVQESLLLAKSLPDSDILVIDSDPKLVRALRLSASRRRLANLSVLQAAWDQSHLAEATGRNFDLVLLPGFPVEPANLASALENLSLCLARPHGRIYLRLPGDGHPFHRDPEILQSLGLSPRLSDGFGPAHPSLLLAAALSGDSLPGSTPRRSAVFSLGDWISALRTNGLHFAACLHSPGILARGLSFGGVDSLRPANAEKLAILLDIVTNPIERHLLFSLTAPAEPPWDQPALLAEWRPSVRFWPREKIPPQSAPFNRVFSVDLEIQRVLSKLSLQLSGYMLELLRNSDGATSLRDLMDRIPHEATLEDLLPALWFFHQSCIATLQPPEGPTLSVPN
jgi:hypothetical protein